jgi:hypothetical protein
MMEELMSTVRASITLLMLLALCVAVMLAGCSSNSATGASGAVTVTATATLKPTRVPIQPGDTSLCDTVSTAEFGQAVGGTITNLIPSARKDPASNQQSVSCLYVSQQPGKGGLIFYLVVNDGPSWYATAKQSAMQSNTDVTDQSGLGDAAFSSMPKGDPPRTALAVLKGNLFFNVLVGGAPATGLPAAKQIAQLILSRV